MNSIEILANGVYLPKLKIDNEYYNKKFDLKDDWIERRTGIKTRYYNDDESIEDMAIKATDNMLKKIDIDVQKIGCIVVATTSTTKLMPGISFEIQKRLNIKKCICLDILAGCSGYINAFDIVRKYIALGEIEYGIVIGVEELSKYLDKEDINTTIILGDGAGATLIGKSDCKKIYFQNIESIAQYGNILTCNNNEKIYMDGMEVYRFAILKTVQSIQNILELSNEKLENIKYIIPHQSNIRIINSMCKKLNIDKSKMYCNLKDIGNTFCASIPIVLNEMFEKRLLQKKDKIILIGYGGGLNLGSILLEV